VLIAPGVGSLLGIGLTAAADRWSRRGIAAVGAGTFALAFAMFAWSPNGVMITAAAALAGFGATGMVDAVEVGLLDVTTGDRLRVWLARQNIAGVAGDLVAPAVLAALAFAGLGWRVAFAIGAVGLAAYAVLLATAPLPPPQPGDDDSDDDQGSGSTWDVLRDPRVWVIGLLSLLAVPFDEPFFGYLIAHLGQTRGVAPGTATTIAAISVCGGLLVHGLAARRPLRASNRVLFMIGAAAMLAGSVVVTVATTLPVIALAACAVSGGLDLCWLAIQHRGLTLRPGQAGQTKAVISTVENVGFGLPLAIGAVADTATLTAAMATFALLAALLLGVAASAERALGSSTPGPPG
jgi:predicted MFS family arabinose efflux permease